MSRASGEPCAHFPAGVRASALSFLFSSCPSWDAATAGRDPPARRARRSTDSSSQRATRSFFDAWNYDAYNEIVAASHTTPLWKVYAVNDTWAGAANVTSIQEFSPPAEPPGKTDTLRFRFLSNGDI